MSLCIVWALLRIETDFSCCVQGICKSSSSGNNNNSARETVWIRREVSTTYLDKMTWKLILQGSCVVDNEECMGGDGCLKGEGCTKTRANWTCNPQVGRNAGACQSWLGGRWKRENLNAHTETIIMLPQTVPSYWWQCWCEEGDVSKTGVANFQTSQRWNTEARQVGNKESEALWITHILPQIQGSQTEPQSFIWSQKLRCFMQNLSTWKVLGKTIELDCVSSRSTRYWLMIPCDRGVSPSLIYPALWNTTAT